MSETHDNTVSYSKFGPVGGALALIGLILLGVAFVDEGLRKTVLASYMYGFIFWSGITLGCLALTLLFHTVRGTFGLPILRLVEAGGSPLAIIVMIILWLPMALFRQSIFKWAQPGIFEKDHVIAVKGWYLNDTTFFVIHIVGFLILLFLSSYLRASSLRHDENLNPEEGFRRTNLAAPGLVVFSIVLTALSTYWVMSLEPHWFSHVLGLLHLVGHSLTAVSFCVILVLINRHKAPYSAIVTPGWTKDIGNLLFAMTLLWTYLTLSQFLIMWSANLPEEVVYYIRRSEGGWNFVGLALVLLQFFLPFISLLAPRTKRYATSLLKVAILIFVMRFIDMYWTVIPALRPHDFLASVAIWTDWIALIFMGGLWLAVFSSQVVKGALMPKYDTRLLEVSEHHA
jgi:hypothetical protein